MGDNGSIPTMQTGYLVTKKFTPKNEKSEKEFKTLMKKLSNKDFDKSVKEFEKRRNIPSGGGLVKPVGTQKMDKMDSKTKKLWNNTEKQVKSQIKSFNKTVNENKNKEWKI